MRIDGGDILVNVDLKELKRLINQYYGMRDILKRDLKINTDPNGCANKKAQRVFLNPCKRQIPNGIVTPIISTEYYASNGERPIMVQRFLDADDIEVILRTYEKEGKNNRRLVLYKQKKLNDR